VGFSIRMWIIIILNGFVIGIALALGWVAQDVAGQVVERRLTTETVANVSDFLARRSLPLSDSMMQYLRELLHAEWVVIDARTDVVTSSLSPHERREFEQCVRESGTPESVTLGGRMYRSDSSVVQSSEARGGASPARLFVLIPNSQFLAARTEASTRVAGLMLPAAVVATMLALPLAFGVTRPIRRLTQSVDRLVPINADLSRVGHDPLAPEDGPGISELRERLQSHGPIETRKLAASLVDLLDRLSVAHRRLVESERLATLGRLSLSVAHELRNPLSGIKMNMRVLLDDPLHADDPGVAAVLREIDRMELYLAELMSFSVGATQSISQWDRKPVAVSSLASSVLTILQGRCRHLGIVIARNDTIDEPLILADANELRRVLMNLIVNAIEAMPSGGTLSVTIERHGQTVRTTVSDTGAGVQSHGQDIFEAFTTNKPNGVGLGLYLCREIVRKHEGTIGYRSSGVGASFWFDMPVVAAGPERIDASPSEIVAR
jgi:signal transduction histidine kinase